MSLTKLLPAWFFILIHTPWDKGYKKTWKKKFFFFFVCQSCLVSVLSIYNQQMDVKSLVKKKNKKKKNSYVNFIAIQDLLWHGTSDVLRMENVLLGLGCLPARLQTLDPV